MSLWKTYIDTPVGRLQAFASDRGLRALELANCTVERQALTAEPQDRSDHPIFVELRQQLAEYFAGSRCDFSIPLDPIGTPFQQQAWEALTRIPYGATRSYGEQAKAIGKPKAVRAVGAANGRNPIAIVVPCHRVIGADGSLTGYAGGVEVKRFLLELESAQPGLWQ